MLIGDQIKELRTSKGITQAELAKKCGLNRNSIYKYEKNEMVPKLEQLHKIAAALGVPSSDFLPQEYTDGMFPWVFEDAQHLDFALDSTLDSVQFLVISDAIDECNELFLSKVKHISDKQLEKELMAIFKVQDRLGKWKLLELAQDFDSHGKYKHYPEED